jgi:thiamine biosynthesis lipoprotein
MQIWQALGLVDWNDMLLDEDAGTVRLRKIGQRIDLGGVAKGYVADGLRKRLRQHGVQRALLNLGGTVAAMGCATRIGIQDPFRPTGVPMGTLTLDDRCAVTSRVYERYAEIGGRRYHHIIDPRTGFPAKSGLVSVTLIGKDAARLDALATASIILGVEESAALLAAQSIEAVFVTDQGRVLITKGLKREFQLLNQTTYTGGAEMSVA